MKESFSFTPAVRSEARLRLAIDGTSGSGKTYTGLLIATTIAAQEQTKVAVIDTEHNSASLYADTFKFDKLRLSAPYTPERFVEAIRAAELAGYGVIMIDSITHEWKGAGGVLEIVDRITQSSNSKNSFVAWSQVDPRHREFVDAMLQSPAHIIATMRSKTAYVEAEEKGRKTYKKAGMAPEQRDGMEYEFTLVLDMQDGGSIVSASKDRTGLFTDPVSFKGDAGRQHAQRIIDWLHTAQPEAPPWYADHLSAIEAASTRDKLMACWTVAKQAAEDRKDREAYSVMNKLTRRLVEAMPIVADTTVPTVTE